MKVLGIDTSTPCGSVGLIEDERVLSEYLLHSPVTHSERLIAAIDLVLNESHLSVHGLDGWSVCLGPGSFTGLRIGVSTVKGLAFATRKPVAGVTSLDALASQLSPTPCLICPVLDARKGEVYTAYYRYDKGNTLRRLSPYRAIRPDDLAREIHEQTVFLGDGIMTYGHILRDSLASLAVFVSPFLSVVRGATVAHMGLTELESGRSLDLSRFTPLYVRSSEAELKWQEKHPSFRADTSER